VRIADLITASLVCDTAMVIRPDSIQAGSSRYLLVGEAYCSGVMDSTAFLGPLPGSTELVG
jgi:hypothetical protein